jgi:uncharacterized membrane protein
MENKLSTEQKLTAGSLIILIAINGAAVGFASYKEDYFIAIYFTAFFAFWYEGLIHMLTWAATSHKNDK